MSAVLLLAACGDDDSSKPNTTSNAPSGTVQKAATGASGASSTAPAGAKRGKPKAKTRSLLERGLGPKPGTGELTAAQRAAYVKAHRACRGLGVKATARAYGVASSNPVEVARAYAVKAFTGSAKPAAFKGCLAGFR
jgi:ABC-type nitrate/sulfonate/bicarbonate transport system substrate-binding protein